MDADNWMIPQNEKEAEALQTVIFFAADYAALSSKFSDMEVVFSWYILPRLKFLSDTMLSQILRITQNNMIFPRGIPDDDEMIRRYLTEVHRAIQKEVDRRKAEAGVIG